MSTRRAAFLDRDGVLNELVAEAPGEPPESPLDPADVRLIPGAAAGMLELSKAGFLLVCVSNQPAAAKGKVSVERLQEVHGRVLELLAAEGAEVAASRLCLHHPDGIVAGLSGACDCRKPAPGMLLEAAVNLDLDLAASWMFGDTDADVGAAHAAGVGAVLVKNPASVHKRLGEVQPEISATDLADGVAQLRGRLAR